MYVFVVCVCVCVCVLCVFVCVCVFSDVTNYRRVVKGFPVGEAWSVTWTYCIVAVAVVVGN